MGGLSVGTETRRRYTENHYGDSNQGGLMGVKLGQRGRLERQLTEESALTLDDSTDSSPQGCAGPAVPRDLGLYRTGMWLAALY